MTPFFEIKPYIPRKLPEKIIIDRKLQRALCQAKRALENYVEPDPQDLSQLTLQEALATSCLSGTKTTLNALHKNPNKYPTVYAMLNALHYARNTLRSKPFSKRMLCKIHSLIKQKTATPQSRLGSFRNTQNWIGPRGCSQKEAYYLPPTPKRVISSMRQWIAYCNTRTDEPLLQLSELVAQFLIIHPFMDGNGRIARLIIPLFLAKQRVLKTPSLFLSPYIQKHRLSYLKALYEITAEGNWHDWTLFFLKGIRSAASLSRKNHIKHLSQAL